MTDTRIAYGAQCTWWDSIQKVGVRGRLPCCPHCGGMLFECPNEEGWNALIDAMAAEHAGYRAYIAWVRGRCFKTWEAARAQYKTETGL